MKKKDLKFGAISIDNSILKEEGYNFNKGLLAQLRQFKYGSSKVIQTDIVHREAINHISLEIENSKKLIKSALRSANVHLKINDSLINIAKENLTTHGTSQEIALIRLQNYYDEIGAVVIESSTHTKLENLIDMYFSTEAPFESGNNKKNEFPDAIALLSISGWAEKNKTKVLIVSKDKGWINFANNSKYISATQSLSNALEKFQSQVKVEKIISTIREESILNEGNLILNEVKNSLSKSIKEQSYVSVASSEFDFDCYNSDIRYLDHDFFKDESGAIDIGIVQVSENSVVLKAVAHVDVEAASEFNFFSYNSHLMDGVHIGTGSFCEYESYNTEILISLSYDISKDFHNYEILNIEVLSCLKIIDFGDIEPEINYDHS
jgi:hypothetical protein